MGRFAVMLCCLAVALSTVHAALEPALAAALQSPDVVFSETFDTDPFTASPARWHKSKAAKYADQPVLVRPPTHPAKGFEGDAGLVLSQERKFYGVYSQFPEPVAMAPRDFVLQYELRLEDSVTCSGAYLKLPRASSAGAALDLSHMDNDTLYAVMFGVDKCGSDTNKVHLIVQTQNPLTLEWQEKHATEVPSPKLDKKTHLYTLHMRADGQYDIYIDKKSAKKGHLLTSFKPPIQPPKEVPDPSSTKPADWQDEEKIADPDDVKPVDWDEAAPRKIADPKAVKPADWDEHAPRTVPDPAAVKPEDWIDEEDGQWAAPMVPNPLCDKPGCGPWSAPTITNPAYKGKWTARKIPNDKYQGPWYQANMTNPAYYEVTDAYAALAPAAAVAVEVLANNAGISFDNVVIARSLPAAWAVADASYALKAAAEAVREKKDRKKAAKSKIKEKKEKGLKGDWRAYAEALLMQAQNYAEEQPWAVWGTAGAIVVALVLLLIPNRNKRELMGGQEGAKAPKEGAKGKAGAGGKDKKDKTEDKAEEKEEEEKDGAK